MEVEVFSHYLGWFSARRHICWTSAGALWESRPRQSHQSAKLYLCNIIR